MNVEIEINHILNNPHCLLVKNYFEDDNIFYLVKPLASKKQLPYFKKIKKFRKFDEHNAFQILKETINDL